MHAARTRSREPGSRRWRGGTFAWNVVLSSALHAAGAVALALMLTRWGCAPPPGAYGDDGENGRGGSGGATVEFSVRGAGTEPRVARADAVPPVEHAAPARAVHRVMVRADRATPHADEPVVESEAAPSEAAPVASPATEQGLRSGGGSDAESDHAGRRVGSIGQQRAMLPPAVACGDLVAGVWLGRRYSAELGEWYTYTLHVRRDAASEGALRGEIAVHFWTSQPGDAQPPPCQYGAQDWNVLETAVGRIEDTRVTFGGVTWFPQTGRCGGAAPTSTYHPDHFTGRIDTARQEFQSVNNDGHTAVDAPTVFRRIRCPDGVSVRSRVGRGDDDDARPAVVPTEPSPEDTHRPAWDPGANTTMPHFQ